jgi:hypothetical protein
LRLRRLRLSRQRSRRGAGHSVGEGRNACAQRGRKARGGRLSYPVVASQADRRRGRGDSRAEPLAAFLAERQVRRILATARRAVHDAPRWDNTAALPSSMVRLIGSKSSLRCRSDRAVPARNPAR